MPKVVPQVSPSYERSVRQLEHLSQNDRIRDDLERARLELAGRTPYGPGSEHSWVIDRAFSAGKASAPPDVTERLNRAQAAAEKETRAVGTGTLGGIVPGLLDPWVAQAVAFGIRSSAPLATALLRLDLPPQGMAAFWAKTTTAATITNQTSEGSAITASADAVIASATDPLGTIAASLDFSAQSLERSGGWFDRVAGEELGRAYGARLEQQIWAGTGANQQLKGFTVMTGNSSSTWHVDSYIANLHREIEGVEHKLAHLDDEVAWWQGTPSSENVERLRSDLESEKTAALAELKRLEPAKGTKARG